jgi:DNA-binding transcriptional ArsR family regulator
MAAGMDPQINREVELLHDRICLALNDSRRLLILYALYQHPHAVNELATALNIPQPGVSHHLKILRERGLVHAHREGTSVTYSLADARLIQALDLLRGVLRDSMAAQARMAGFDQPWIEPVDSASAPSASDEDDNNP